MVAGPGVFICQDCVHICNQVLATDEPQPPMAPSSRSDRVRARLISA